MTPTLSKVHGREVLDSRGNPTIEVEVIFSDGSFGRGIVPSGASKGKHEALELRDGDPNRYLGMGTLLAVRSVNETLFPLLKGKSFETLESLDRVLMEADGTTQKSRLGANAILGVSVAFAHALSQFQKKPLYLLINEQMKLNSREMRLPVPLMNILNGGVHANNGLECQEFMIVPHGFKRFSEALRAGSTVFQHLKRTLEKKGLSTAVGDEGGFAPKLESNTVALELICEAIHHSGYILGDEISVALDVAASSFFDSRKGQYCFRRKGETHVSSSSLMEVYSEWITKFPIVSIEDPLDENDWAGWKKMTEAFGKKVQLVGDDIFVTRSERLERGVREGIANAILIKINQVGSLKETFETMRLAYARNYNCVVSHRSGETEDVTIAHLAVASGSGQIKTGSLSRGERTAKYNELLRIEENAAVEGHAIAFEGEGKWLLTPS